MKTIQFTREIPIKKEVDVFVAGGGPAGVAAAVTAARLGAKVFLTERGQCFGGAAAMTLVPAFMRFSDGENFVSGGIGREVFDALYGADAPFTEKEYSIDIEKLKRIYDDMMERSGADFLFASEVIGIECGEDGAIAYAVVKGKEALYAVRAKVFIDTTGDGTLAVWNGAPYEMGDGTGAMMPGTLCTLWNNIDWSRAVVELGRDPDNRCLPQAFEDGVFTVKDPGLPGMWRFRDNLGGGNIGHVFGVDGTDEASLTKGVIDARRRMPEYEYYYNHYLEGYENAKIVVSGGELGIRETRRILGERVLTVDSYFSHEVFDDEIGRYCYPIDIHASAIGKKEKLDGIYEQDYAKGESYGIPYGCLLPKNTKNLLVAGRTISADREMMGSARVMPCCFITGMAAGAAAAQAVQQGYTVREVEVKQLQKTLKKLGAFLPNCE